MSRLEVQSRGWHGIALAILGVVGGILYAPIFPAGFWTDDFVFAQIAKQRGVLGSLIYYADPRNLELQWYRPLQGLQWSVEYLLFGFDPTGYHIVNVAFHVINSWLIYWLAARLTRHRLSGFITAFAFLALPRISVNVNWVGVADPLLGMFWLSALALWIEYRRTERASIRWLALLMFIGALLAKEMGATLIVVLVLADFLLAPRATPWRGWIKRYAPFVLVLIPYIVIEYIVSTRGVYVGQVAYRPSSQVFPNALQYARWFLVPWNVGSPWDELALALACALLLYTILVKRQTMVAFGVLTGLATLLPVLPFPFALERYMYLPAIASMLLVGLGFAAVFDRAPNRWIRTVWLSGGVIFLIWNSALVNEGAVNFAAFIRDTRLQFRPLFQSHPTLPTDTIFYFIDPPFPTPTISAMLYVRYGANAYGYGTDRGRVAGLRNHTAAYIYYRDDQNTWQEIQVAPQVQARATPTLPARFADGLVLENLELAADQVKRNTPLGLLIYARATQPISKNYTLFVHLIDAAHQVVAGYDGQPHQGSAPTRSWQIGDVLVADGIIIPIDSSIAPGIYSLELGWYDADTGQRLGLVDLNGQFNGETILLAPIELSE